MTHRSGLPPIPVGVMLAVSEPDYRYGLGLLRLRVTSVPEGQETFGGEWMCLHGMEIDWRGVEMGSRRVLVRIVVVRQHVAAVGGGCRVGG
jgi:hypothetical protein